MVRRAVEWWPRRQIGLRQRYIRVRRRIRQQLAHNLRPAGIGGDRRRLRRRFGPFRRGGLGYNQWAGGLETLIEVRSITAHGRKRRNRCREKADSARDTGIIQLFYNAHEEAFPISVLPPSIHDAIGAFWCPLAAAFCIAPSRGLR